MGSDSQSRLSRFGQPPNGGTRSALLSAGRTAGLGAALTFKQSGAYVTYPDPTKPPVVVQPGLEKTKRERLIRMAMIGGGLLLLSALLLGKLDLRTASGLHVGQLEAQRSDTMLSAAPQFEEGKNGH